MYIAHLFVLRIDELTVSCLFPDWLRSVAAWLAPLPGPPGRAATPRRVRRQSSSVSGLLPLCKTPGRSGGGARVGGR